MKTIPRRSVALFVVRAVHTLIFISLSWAVLYILYCGLTNRVSRRTGVAVAAVLGEAMIFVLNGRRCPLTKMAEEFGAENGTMGDIFLPQWFARRIPEISSTLIATGFLAMLWYRVRASGHEQRRDTDKTTHPPFSDVAIGTV